MFWHIFQYRMKCIVRDKEVMFWTLIFPIVLATFFNMAFSNLNNIDTFNTIPFAVVNNDAYQKDATMQETLKSLSTAANSSSETKNGKPLLKLSLVSKAKADEILTAGEISGYLDLDGGINLYFKKSGMDQTIIKSVFDQYIQNAAMVTTIMTTNQNAIGQGLIDSLNRQNSYFEADDGNTTNPDNTVIYFYTILAMACFYGGFLGMKEVNTIQADLSSQGARVSVAPIHKMKTFISSITAASLVQLASILLLLAYLTFVIRIDFGTQTGYILLLCVSGCVMGVSFGAMIGALIKGNEGVKTGILIGTSMTLSFLSGMMYVQIKYIVTTAVPILAYLNPLNLITDAFYALYYYQSHERYFINLGVIWIFIIIFSVITIMRLRRLKYASI